MYLSEYKQQAMCLCSGSLDNLTDLKKKWFLNIEENMLPACIKGLHF